MVHTPKKSPTIATYLRERAEEIAQDRKDLRRAMAKWPKYPHNRRGAAFCWLWDNHDGVLKVMQGHYLTWHHVAFMANEDGVTDRWGKPPSANALRRVFVRVSAEIEARRKQREGEADEVEDDRGEQTAQEWRERAHRLGTSRP